MRYVDFTFQGWPHRALVHGAEVLKCEARADSGWIRTGSANVHRAAAAATASAGQPTPVGRSGETETLHLGNDAIGEVNQSALEAEATGQIPRTDYGRYLRPPLPHPFARWL